MLFIITIAGQGGIGKTTASKYMALNWAEGSSKELEIFDFVFHITLKDVTSKKTMAEVIIEQHGFLSGNEVNPEEIKTIIKGHINHTILFIIDGYDEYQPGTCPELDNAIKRYSLINCWIVLTSRETKDFLRIAEFLDAEAEITGFDADRVKEYITKYVGSTERCDQLIDIARESGIISDITKDVGRTERLAPLRHFPLIDITTGRGIISESESPKSSREQDDYGILCIPFLLNMICELFMRNISLPKTKTGIISAIVDRCPGWEEIRKSGEKGLKNVADTIQKLGKFVLDRLLKGDFHQQFSKVRIIWEKSVA